MSNPTPDAWLCPITYAVMTDPVVMPDGRTYERDAITEWLHIHGTSPFTREPMREDDGIPNMALREIISGTGPEQIVPTEESSPETVVVTTRKTIHCLVDRSGSMGMRIATQGYEQDGFTRLDLVKHTLLTLVHSLPSDYSLSITTFDSRARTIMGATRMNVQGKSTAIYRVETIDPGSTTNLWDGFRQVFTLCEDESTPTILVFTDGQSNQNPPQGIHKTLLRYLHDRNIQPIIHTIGYSYDIDSSLLHSLSSTYNGLFGFIPDCTMIGTVFINILAKALEMTEQPIEDSTGYHTVPMCKSLVRYLEKEVTLYDHSYADSRRDRLANIQDWIEQMPTSPLFTEEYRQSVLRDIDHDDPNKGQIGKAVSCVEWYTKWGCHYLRSLHLSHLRGVCVNFKDESLQYYKSPRFTELQSRMESIFVLLPSPTPTAVPSGPASYGSVMAPPMSGGTSMRTYYDDSAGCFTGDTLVLTKQDNAVEYRTISSLKPGDVVATTSPDTYTRVRFLVHYERLHTQICSLNENLHITKYHPVRSCAPHEASDWTFPIDITTPEEDTLDLYNLVLTDGHMVRCTGYECVTLGHHIDDETAGHAYFGTDRIVEDIAEESMKQSGNGIFGIVNINRLRVIRNDESGLIERYVFNESE